MCSIGTWCLHLQGRKIKMQAKRREALDQKLRAHHEDYGLLDVSWGQMVG
jgi:hypothetical protein